jgi:hypothetical protein
MAAGQCLAGYEAGIVPKWEPTIWMMTFLVFAGVALTVYFVLLPRQQDRRSGWRSGDGGGVDFNGSSSSSNHGGWSFAEWVGSSSTDSSGNPTDSGSDGGGDSGGGGDGGGGDGGGGD